MPCINTIGSHDYLTAQMLALFYLRSEKAFFFFLTPLFELHFAQLI